MRLPYSKMPSNVVERFGNSSGVTIPLTITSNVGDRLVHEQFRVCLADTAWPDLGSMLLEPGQSQIQHLNRIQMKTMDKLEFYEGWQKSSTSKR